MIEAPARARNEMKGCGEVGICDCGDGSSTRGCWPQTTQRFVCRETKQLQRCLLCDHGQSEAGPLEAMFAGEKGRRIRRGCSVATAPRRLALLVFAPRLCDACSLDRPAPA
jgi:hypothetical protein